MDGVGAADAGYSGMASRARSGVSTFYAGVKSKIDSAGGGVFIAMTVLVLVIIVVAAYGVYRFMITSLKSATLVKSPLHTKNNSKAIDSDKIPSMDNGLEYAISFWLYVEAIHNNEEFKTLLTIGTPESFSFLSVMDRKSNRMYIAMLLSSNMTKTSIADAKTAISEYKTARENNNDPPADIGYMVVAVEYVPLQRWVNVAVVANQDIVTVYLDGDIYSVTSVDMYMASGVASGAVAEPLGSMVIGDALNGANAFVSRVQFFNYAISVYHARILYNAGPVDRGLLGHMGLPRYKMQWPITTVDDGSTENKDECET